MWVIKICNLHEVLLFPFYRPIKLKLEVILCLLVADLTLSIFSEACRLVSVRFPPKDTKGRAQLKDVCFVRRPVGPR